MVLCSFLLCLVCRSDDIFFSSALILHSYVFHAPAFAVAGGGWLIPKYRSQWCSLHDFRIFSMWSFTAILRCGLLHCCITASVILYIRLLFANIGLQMCLECFPAFCLLPVEFCISFSIASISFISTFISLFIVFCSFFLCFLFVGLPSFRTNFFAFLAHFFRVRPPLPSHLFVAVSL